MINKTLFTLIASFALAIPFANSYAQQWDEFDNGSEAVMFAKGERSEMAFGEDIGCGKCDKHNNESGKKVRGDKSDKKSKKEMKDKSKHEDCPFMPKGGDFPYALKGKDDRAHSFFGMRPGRMPIMQDKDVLDLIKDVDPAFHKQLKEMKTSKQAQYKITIGMLGRNLFFVKNADGEREKNLIQKTIARVKLEMEVRDITKKYFEAKESEKASIKNDLKAKLANLFDIKLAEQQTRVDKMEEDLAKLKKDISDRKAAKNKIVDSRLEELTEPRFHW